MMEKFEGTFWMFKIIYCHIYIHRYWHLLARDTYVTVSVQLSCHVSSRICPTKLPRIEQKALSYMPNGKNMTMSSALIYNIDYYFLITNFFFFIKYSFNIILILLNKTHLLCPQGIRNKTQKQLVRQLWPLNDTCK